MENKIRALRSEMGLSQEELARRCGVSRQTINAIENNKYDPTLTLAFHLAGVLGTTVDELFLDENGFLYFEGSRFRVEEGEAYQRCLELCREALP